MWIERGGLTGWGGRSSIGAQPIAAGQLVRKDHPRMAIRIKARNGEGVEQMMRRFKKLCEKEGLTKDIKKREFYEKPSERKRRDQRKAQSRAARERD